LISNDNNIAIINNLISFLAKRLPGHFDNPAPKGKNICDEDIEILSLDKNILPKEASERSS
jgi:hypothetical protein